MQYSYLALGDSYTIGEQVELFHSFPYQAIEILRKQGMEFYAPEIVAVTGWTTCELLAAIKARTLLSKYNFVSLLIGVNNQYRGYSKGEFENEFEILLQKSLELVDTNEQYVFVLSIPDWGITPFAEGKDIEKISGEIDAFNNICDKLCRKYGIGFIEITKEYRADAGNADFLAADKLHPSGKEYAKWAQKLSTGIKFSIVNK